jgi:hypothetical protein
MTDDLEARVRDLESLVAKLGRKVLGQGDAITQRPGER